MGRSVNSVTLLGNTGADASKIRGGMSVNLATSERWTDDAGQTQERTSWHRIVVFGKRGEALAEIIRKGARIAVTGSLRSSSYTDKDGAKRYSSDVIASDVVLLDAPPEGRKRSGAPSDPADMPGEG